MRARDHYRRCDGRIVRSYILVSKSILVADPNLAAKWPCYCKCLSGRDLGFEFEDCRYHIIYLIFDCLYRVCGLCRVGCGLDFYHDCC